MKLRVFNVIARMLLLTLCMAVFTAKASETVEQNDESSTASSLGVFSDAQPLVIPESFKMTAQKAHQFIGDQQADLLGDGSQLVSLYYFGQNNATSVVGLERVGDDYLPIRWLLVFEGQTLLGWYYPVGEFPVRFKDGHLAFPRGASAEDIFLFPHPPSLIQIEGVEIPFITPGSELNNKDTELNTTSNEVEEMTQILESSKISAPLPITDKSLVSNPLPVQ